MGKVEAVEDKNKVPCPQCSTPMDEIAGSKKRSKCFNCGYYYDCC